MSIVNYLNQFEAIFPFTTKLKVSENDQKLKANFAVWKRLNDMVDKMHGVSGSDWESGKGLVLVGLYSEKDNDAVLEIVKQKILVQNGIGPGFLAKKEKVGLAKKLKSANNMIKLIQQLQVDVEAQAIVDFLGRVDLGKDLADKFRDIIFLKKDLDKNVKEAIHNIMNEGQIKSVDVTVDNDLRSVIKQKKMISRLSKSRKEKLRRTDTNSGESLLPFANS